jgi:glutamate---cysteine ligase / carboxylate-amine ligase
LSAEPVAVRSPTEDSRVVDHAFGSSAPFTVGLEEELLLVRSTDHRLAHEAGAVLPRTKLTEGEADHEAFAAEVELRSPPSETTAGAVAAIAAARAAIRDAGGTPMASGLHPSAELFDVDLVDTPRYERVEREMRGLIRRTPECALHVHVGMPDQDAAAAALTGLREALPVIQGLGANSPFWFGRDSGLASARATLVRSYPGRGVPPALRSWDDYIEALEAIAAGGGPTDYTMVWWDIRLQPRIGTVELRELDVQTDIDAAAGIAALVRGIAMRAAERPVERPAHSHALHWSCWRAVRDGLDSEVHHEGELLPLREAARRLVATVEPSPELEGIERILTDGNGAEKQRAAHAQSGMRGLLRDLVRRTAD